MARKQRTDPEETYLNDVKQKAMAAMDLLDEARTETQLDDDYYNSKQWTSDEIRILNARNQPALTFNECKPAVNAIIGIFEKGRTDPKAWGRGPEDQDAAEVATDSLRYVADINRFQAQRSQMLKDMLVPGICCCVVEVDEDREVVVRKGRSEEYFYDPYSREPNFSDARFDGFAKWMDEQDVIDLYPDKEAMIRRSIDAAGMVSNTYQDRPTRSWSWGDPKQRRTMVFEMYHRRGPIWYKCVFVSGGILESGPTEYKDAKGKSKKPIIAQSAYVDRENKRYGVVRDMRGPQDALNKGWSKAVHILNVAKLRVDPGTQDIDMLRREYAKPDGIIEARQDQVEELGDKQLLPSHVQMLDIASARMQRQSPSPGIVGRQAAGQSGKAIIAEQQAGLTEQSPLLASFDDFTLRIYRAMWDCIKQFWTEQKYIRVTDDENAPKFVMLNEPALAMGPDGQPIVGPDGKPVIDPNVKPRNAPAEMDVDIIIDSTPDTAVIQEDQFAKLIELEQARPGSFPTDVLIEASSLPKKRLILDKLKKAAEESQGKPGPEQAMMAAEAQKVQLQLQTEQQKAQLQLQSKEQMAQIDAQAHAAQLQREDASEQAKAQRQAMLEQQKFDNDMARLQAAAQSDAQKVQLQIDSDRAKKQDEIDHAGRQKQMDFHFRTKEAQLAHGIKMAEADGGEMGDDLKTKPPAHMEALGQGLRDIAASLAMLSKPRRLVKDPRTGEKRVEVANDTVN